MVSGKGETSVKIVVSGNHMSLDVFLAVNDP